MGSKSKTHNLDDFKLTIFYICKVKIRQVLQKVY